MSEFQFTVNVDGLDALDAHLLGVAENAVLKVAYDIQHDIDVSMSGPKSGRFYGSHQASAPGETPAVDTGNLRASVGVSQRKQLEALVTAGADYAPHLEFGTRFMAARPFMGPAFKAKEDEFEQAVRRIFDAASK